MKKVQINKGRITGALLIFLIISLLPASAKAQDTLSLEQCYVQVEQHFPLAQQMNLLQGSHELKIRNYNKNWLPTINLNGQVSYQSDVTKVEIELPSPLPALDMPELSKDWYKATLDVSQTIWDGNVTSYQKQVEDMTLEVDQVNVQSELYKLKEQVNRFYFSIILLDHNEALLISTQKQLQEKRKEVEAGIKYGAVLQSTADALDAEMLTLEQKLAETRIDRKGLIAMLGELISLDISPDIHLVMPDPQIMDYTFQNQRFENTMFSLQQNKLDLLSRMITTEWNPKFFAFGQAGIGRPGLNMLSNNFEPFYIVGIKLNWHLLNWNKNKNEKKILGIQSAIIGTQQAAFEKNLKIQAEKELAEILKTLDVIKQDHEIIALREKITRSASAQLSNGVITSSEYVTRLTEERQAKLSYEIHQVQLVRAKLAYLYQQGKL
jgi:outer membrane protein TolC